MYNAGWHPLNGTVLLPFNSFAATGASSAMGGTLAASDVLVYKNGGTTERASAAGITVAESFDGKVGMNLLSIDSSDNTDAGFYVAGGYLVGIDSVTIDGVVVRAWIGGFELGVQPANVTQFGGVAGTFASGLPDVNLAKIDSAAVNPSAAQLGVNIVGWAGDVVPVPSVVGVPEVDPTHWLGTALSTPSVPGVPEVDAILGEGQPLESINDLYAGLFQSPIGITVPNPGDIPTIEQSIWMTVQRQRNAIRTGAIGTIYAPDGVTPLYFLQFGSDTDPDRSVQIPNPF